MQNTPNFNLSYPESGDHTRTWEYWQSLATQLDTLLAAQLTPVLMLAAPEANIALPGGANTPLNMARQIISGGAWTKTGAEYTVPVTGKYRVTAQGTFANSGSTVDQGRNVAVRLNGASDLARGYTLAHNLSATAFCTNIAQLTAGQTVSMTASASIACDVLMKPYTLLLVELIRNLA